MIYGTKSRSRRGWWWWPEHFKTIVPSIRIEGVFRHPKQCSLPHLTSTPLQAMGLLQFHGWHHPHHLQQARRSPLLCSPLLQRDL